VQNPTIFLELLFELNGAKLAGCGGRLSRSPLYFICVSIRINMRKSRVRHLSFSNPQLGLASIIIGTLSLLVLIAPFLGPDRILVSPGLGLVGSMLGAMSIKTRRGMIGIFLSLLPILYLVFIFLIGAAYSPR